MGFGASDGQVEGMGTLGFAIDDKLSPQDGGVGYFREGSNPEFHAFGSLAGEDKLIGFGIVNSKSLNPFAVAAVVELRQTETADILSFNGSIVELFMEGG